MQLAIGWHVACSCQQVHASYVPATTHCYVHITRCYKVECKEEVYISSVSSTAGADPGILKGGGGGGGVWRNFFQKGGVHPGAICVANKQKLLKMGRGGGGGGGGGGAGPPEHPPPPPPTWICPCTVLHSIKAYCRKL